MFDYQRHFDAYCSKENLDVRLSFDMPSGYEDANGTFEISTQTLFINKANLSSVPDYEKLFYLFHELRHAEQYLVPDRFDPAIRRSLQYIIMFDGTCHKVIEGNYHQCNLDGEEDELINLYLGQPYEVDANTFAYEQTKAVYGELEALRKLYEFWIPRQPVPNEVYDSVFSTIDKKVNAGD